MKDKKSFRLRVLFSFLIFVLVFSFVVFCFISFANKNIHSQNTFDPDDMSNTPIVIIDAGHGGEDGGTIGVNGIYEKELNLKIAKKLETILKSSGVKVVMTRSTDTLLYDRNENYDGRKKALDMAKRLEISSSYENAIFVSIHMNSFPIAKYNGLQVYYSPNDPLSKEFADRIQSLTKDALMQENTRKTKASDGKIFLLDRMNIPSVLVECGFLSNPAECERLCNEAYQNELAAAICCAILEHID